MLDLFNLNGKVAVVTGGNGGIGKAIARALASAGADIAIAARNPAKTEQAAAEIKRDFGRRVLQLESDVQQEESIQAVTKKVIDSFGRIDILVNNAGITINKMPQDLEAADYDRVMSTDLRAAFLCCKAVYPAMKKAGGGKIINIGSMTSIFGAGPFLPYTTSKGGIVAMSRSLAVAWARDNIQVNAILLGFIDTELTKKIRSENAGAHERILARTPAGRWGRPDDLQGTAIFLATAASNFVTGIALPVDGGYSVSME